MVGFITAGDTRLYGFSFDKEIYALYIDPDYQGQGIGRAMMEKMMGIMRENGEQRIGVGCLKANPSTRFYEKMGGRFLEEVMWTYEKGKLPEQVFLFEI
ncbi:MAG: GNAT family N-acetyltransferase [Alphaproteobacteria bacterium]|nr:GNAT family N-acetyltransferase [Alphaproteobacteria bacterium]